MAQAIAYWIILHSIYGMIRMIVAEECAKANAATVKQVRKVQRRHNRRKRSTATKVAVR
jgi:hypothetical protein